MHDASPFVSTWRKKLEQVLRIRLPKSSLRTVSDNQNHRSIESNHPLDVRRQIHMSTEKTRQEMEADGPHCDREGYVMGRYGGLFVSEVDLVTETNP